MAEKRRQHTREFKLETVRLISSGERTPGDLARDPGVRVDVLGGSKQAEGRAGLKKGDVFPGNGDLTGKDEELRGLRRELEEAKQERDFLKKAAAYFAKGPG